MPTYSPLAEVVQHVTGIQLVGTSMTNLSNETFSFSRCSPLPNGGALDATVIGIVGIDGEELFDASEPDIIASLEGMVVSGSFDPLSPRTGEESVQLPWQLSVLEYSSGMRLDWAPAIYGEEDCTLSLGNYFADASLANRLFLKAYLTLFDNDGEPLRDLSEEEVRRFLLGDDLDQVDIELFEVEVQPTVSESELEKIGLYLQSTPRSDDELCRLVTAVVGVDMSNCESISFPCDDDPTITIDSCDFVDTDNLTDASCEIAVVSSRQYQVLVMGQVVHCKQRIGDILANYEYGGMEAVKAFLAAPHVAQL